MSTLVSNYELLFKPLTPTITPELATLGRRALQGYFVSITNLGTQDYVYTLEYRVSLPSGVGVPGRRDLSSAVVITDVAGDNTFSTPFRNGATNLWTSSVSIPAGKTALVVLLPNVGLPDFFTGPSDVEVRGHLRLALNCRLQQVGTIGDRPIFFFVPQSNEPVPVLVSAEHRTTFLPNGWPAMSSDNLDFDQVGTSIALAAGRGEFDITPRTSCFFFLASEIRNAMVDISTGGGILSQLSAEGRAEAMIETMALIAGMGDEEAEMVNTVAKRMRLECSFGDGKSARKKARD